MRRLAVGLCVCFATASCLLAVDLSGLAGSLPTDAGPDAPTEAAGLDAGSGADGAADGAPDASGCARFPDASFCVDFDHPSALTISTWSEVDPPSAVGSITLVSDPVVSAPGAAHFDLTTSSAPCSFLQLRRDFTGSFSALTARLAVRPDDGDRFLAIFANTGGVLTYRVLVSFDPLSGGRWAFNAIIQKAQSGAFTTVGSGNLTLDTSPLGQFHDVTVELTAGTTKNVVVRLDDKSFPIVAPADFVLTDPMLQVGPYCLLKPMRVTVDDVAVTLTP